MKEFEIYKCYICGNRVEVQEVGGEFGWEIGVQTVGAGTLSCCGKDMEYIKEDSPTQNHITEDRGTKTDYVTKEFKETYSNIEEISRLFTLIGKGDIEYKEEYLTLKILLEIEIFNN